MTAVVVVIRIGIVALAFAVSSFLRVALLSEMAIVLQLTLSVIVLRLRLLLVIWLAARIELVVRALMAMLLLMLLLLLVRVRLRRWRRRRRSKQTRLRMELEVATKRVVRGSVWLYMKVRVEKILAPQFAVDVWRALGSGLAMMLLMLLGGK